MPFATRNAMYLRISEQRILPMYLYLDERHVDWMSDYTLQLVIQDLQPLLREVLRSSSTNAKKVNVKRGDTYQFCYFLRPTKVTEAVLLKHKEFHLQPPRSPSPVPDAIVKQSKSKRKRESQIGRGGKSSRSRTSRSASVRSSMDEEDEEVDVAGEAESSRGRTVAASPAPAATRSSARSQISPEPAAIGHLAPDVVDDDDDELREVADEDLIMVKEEPVDSMPNNVSNGTEPQIPEEDEKDEKGDWKPVMHLRYSGFHTSASQLVVVVEPWPPLPESSYAPPSSRFSDRSTSYRSQSRAFARSTITVTPGPDGGSQRLSASVSIPNSRRGGTNTATPALDGSDREGTASLDIPNSRSGGLGVGGRRRRMSATPLFLPAGTPFGEEDDDDDHDNYEERLRQGRERLPTVSGADDDISMDVDGESDGALSMSTRLMASSQMGPRYTGGAGPEVEQEGEVSAVMGDEDEPGV